MRAVVPRASAVPRRQTSGSKREAETEAVATPTPAAEDELTALRRRSEGEFGPIIEKDESESRPRIVTLGSGWAAYTFISSLDESAYSGIVVSPRYTSSPANPSSTASAVVTLGF
jgi:hypothetical protein